MKEVIIIKKKGADDHTTISVRMKEETLVQLDSLSRTTNQSRNYLINYLLKTALNNVIVED